MLLWIPESLKKIYPYTPPPKNGLTAGYKFGTDAGSVGGVGKVVYGTGIIPRRLKIIICPEAMTCAFQDIHRNRSIHYHPRIF